MEILRPHACFWMNAVSKMSENLASDTCLVKYLFENDVMGIVAWLYDARGKLPAKPTLGPFSAYEYDLTFALHQAYRCSEPGDLLRHRQNGRRSPTREAC